MKLAQYLKRSHNISRREYGDMINDKALSINGELCVGYSHTVNTGDTIAISLPDGTHQRHTVSSTVRIHKPVIVVFNKPVGYVVSRDDQHNKTIYDILPPSWRKDFYYIGRLDKDSHGLLLLTNNTRLVDWFQSPGSFIPKVYHIRINRPLRTQHIKPMRRGVWVTLDGEQIQSQQELDDTPDADYLDCAGITKIDNNPAYLRVTLFSGKNRHIRRLFAGFGYVVTDLMRVKHDKYELGTIKSGKYRIYPAPSYHSKKNNK